MTFNVPRRSFTTYVYEYNSVMPQLISYCDGVNLGICKSVALSTHRS